jgi:hypothetical protein
LRHPGDLPFDTGISEGSFIHEFLPLLRPLWDLPFSGLKAFLTPVRGRMVALAFAATRAETGNTL